MADSIVIQLDLETGKTKSTFDGIESDAKKSGARSAKKFSKAFKKNTSDLLKTATKITAAIGSIASALTFRASIKAAQEQEDAINRLNTSLQLSGAFSEQASRDLQDYASSLQQVTRFGDEAVLNQLALAKSFGATNTQAKQVVSAAADLAASFGIDLQSATRNVAKTLGGYAGELGEVIPELKNLTQEQLRAGAGVDLLASKFSGAARKEVLTFSGATQQLSNTFGDLLEEIGFIITKNPIVLSGIKSLNKTFQDTIKTVNTFRQNFNVFDDLIEPLLNFNKAIIRNVIKPFELVGNFSKVAFNIVDLGVATIINAFAKLGGIISRVFSALGIQNELTDFLINFEQNTLQGVIDKSASVTDAIAKIGDTSFSDNLATRNDELRNYFTEQQAIVAANASAANNIQSQQNEVAKASLLGLGSVFSTVFAGVNTTVDTSQKKIQEVNDRVKQFSSEAANSLRQGLAAGAGNAFKEFGKALVTGENALQAFTDSLLKTIADQAVALGTKFILEGAAYAFLPGYQALSGPLIAAGAALAAFGGALGATIGGGDSGGGSGGAATTQDTNEFLVEETTAPDEVEQRQPQTNVEVVVQGSLVQQEELGTFIAETLSDSFGKQGVSLTDARIA